MAKKQKKFADDGWAIWVDGDDTSTVYINDWLNPKGKSYVDISVRVYGAKETKNVNFFIPFEIERSGIFSGSFGITFSQNQSIPNEDTPQIIKSAPLIHSSISSK